MTKALRRVFDFAIIITAILVILYLLAVNTGLAPQGANNPAQQSISFQTAKLPQSAF